MVTADRAAPAVVLEDVGHAYSSSPVLSGVSLRLAEGRVGLIGVNGAGKSTLLRIVTTALVPTQGRAAWPGLGRELGEVRRRIGYLPQQVTVPPRVRVHDFLAHLAWLKALPRAEHRGQVDAVLARTGLTDRRTTRVGELSGGMYRRLLLAQALLGDPDVLVLDEPTVGLDPEQRINVRQIVESTSGPRLVVISSHTIDELALVVDRLVMLDSGRVVFDDTVPALRRLGETYPVPGMSVLEAAFVRLRSLPSGA